MCRFAGTGRGHAVRTLGAALGALAVLGAPSSAAAVDATPLDTWVVDGDVSAMAIAGNTAYLGGAFSQIGPRTGPGVGLDAVTGKDRGFPMVERDGSPAFVRVVVPDGSGGFYLGGLFDTVGGQPRRNAARVLADGSVAAWNPNVSGLVAALARSGSTVYLGGGFAGANAVNGSLTRDNAAAVDATSGVATAWDPDLNGAVAAIAVAGSTVYLGGAFAGANAVNGTLTRNRLAAVDAATAVALPWDPNANNTVNSLAVSGASVFIGGNFSGAAAIDGKARTRVAAVDGETGVATTFAPQVNGTVSTLAVLGSDLYIGGAFSSVGGAARHNAAAVDVPSGGGVTSWAPEPNNRVYDLTLSGSTVYLAGDFGVLGGRPRSFLGAVSAITGAVTDFDPHASSAATSVAVADSTVYAGGQFAMVNSVPRRNAAAVDLTTGEATAWDPGITAPRAGDQVRSPVTSLAVAGATVYIGGGFHGPGSVNQSALRNHVAAVDATTGLVQPWNPNPDGAVLKIKPAGSTVFLSGYFGSLSPSVGGGRAQMGAAEVSAGSGALTGWNPKPDGLVTDMALSASQVYLAGTFLHLDTRPRSTVGAVDRTTAVATSWEPVVTGTRGGFGGPSGVVVSLAVSGSTVYLGGLFTAISGVPRNNGGAVDATTGAVSAWNPNFVSYVLSLTAAGGTVYASGMFGGPTAVNGNVERNFVAALDATTGTAVAPDFRAPNLVGMVTADDGLVGITGFGVPGGGWGSFGTRGSFAILGTAPAITAQAADRTADAGTDATFTVAASGAPAPTLQWQQSSDGGATFSDLAGQTGASLTVSDVTAAQSGRRYRLRARSLAGTALSAPATLTVAAAPAPGPAPPVQAPPTAAPPTPTVPPAPVAGRVKLVTRTATITKGVARVILSCTGATACTGRVRLTVLGTKGKRIPIAAATYSIKAGKRSTLRLRVSSRNQKLLFRLRNRRGTAATLTPKSSPALATTLTLKRAKR
ncbi:MAG: hypothetical protein JWO90_637 [Solirubrobacterales bacterium]|nr:hypothetical protein [Solirubrobacterales bacterium]